MKGLDTAFPLLQFSMVTMMITLREVGHCVYETVDETRNTRNHVKQIRVILFCII